MITTENEALTKWCPHVRMARHEVFEYVTERLPEINGKGSLNVVKEDHQIVAGCNTDALGRLRVPRSARCIASDCMMWRWVPKYEMAMSNAPGVGLLPTNKPLPSTHGYCGLAGVPVKL